MIDSEKLPVPFYSQYSDSISSEWQSRACTIVNLKMVLDYFAQNCTLPFPIPSTMELLTEAESIQGYGERGWTHDTIVLAAHNHGVQAYRQEFRSRDENVAEQLSRAGIEKMRATLTGGLPVIVSIQKENGSYHTVCLVGMTEETVFYHDPELGAARSVSLEQFAKMWRRLAIFFE